MIYKGDRGLKERTRRNGTRQASEAKRTKEIEKTGRRTDGFLAASSTKRAPRYAAKREGCRANDNFSPASRAGNINHPVS